MTTLIDSPVVEKHDLVVSRTFDAPIERVWQAWTDPALVMQWWGPDHFTSPSAEIHFEEGKTSILCMRAPEDFGGQDFYSTWDYVKIVPLERIEYIHNLSTADGVKVDPTSIGMPEYFPQDQLHIVNLTSINDNKTELTITEYGWNAGHMLEMSEMGMKQCLEKMAVLLAGS